MKKIIILLPIVFGVAIAAFSMSLLQADAMVAAPQEGPDSAQVIIQYAPGDIFVKPISFTASISGVVALEFTGLDVVTKDYSWGIAVCSIGGVGCPADNCFCGGSTFWNYSYWDGTSWQAYTVGPTDTEINDGAIEGWRWGEWSDDSIPPPAVAQALDWLLDQQFTDGGYGDDSGSVETTLSIGAVGLDAANWRKQPGYNSLMDYLLANGGDYSRKGAAEAGKLASGLVSSNGCSPYFTYQPMDYYDPGTGKFNPESGFHIWGMLGTTSLSETVPVQSVSYLKSTIQSDGGWEWNSGFGSDSNTTALAVQALTAGGDTQATTEVISGMNFLKNSQNTDGGFYYTDVWGATDSDTNSTAYAVQAILAAGEDPTSGRWVISETNPISYLLNMQLPDGSFEYIPGFGSNLSATQQAIPALMHKFNPLKVNSLPACPVLFLPSVYRQ
ncbi:prenyltransferase/squalene oxidase repeat-containing protein [Chloroflexota bacterium]